LVIQQGSVKLLQIGEEAPGPANTIMEALPGLVEKVTQFFDNRKKEKEAAAEAAAEAEVK
jgi:uncharacterized spore protein YtfJ